MEVRGQRRNIMREKSLRLERLGSTRSFASSAEGSSLGTCSSLMSLSLADSLSSFASRDSVCRSPRKPMKRNGGDAIKKSEGPLKTISAQMEQRLQELERRKGHYSSSRVLDLDVITAGEDDEESHTRGNDSFATLESYSASEYDRGYDDDEKEEKANKADN